MTSPAAPVSDPGMETDKEFLDRAIAVTFERLRKARKNVAALPEPLRVVAIVCSAQGVIDTEGLRIFFENDWPENPPYSDFVDAYRTAGAAAGADAIAAAAALFAFAHPEREIGRRCETLAGPAGARVDELDRELRGGVWERLTAFARAHEAAFADAGVSRARTGASRRPRRG